MLTHVVREGYGFWDVTKYPYGGDFHRATSAFGVTLVRKSDDNKHPAAGCKYPDEAVCQVAGRTLIVKVDHLLPI